MIAASNRYETRMTARCCYARELVFSKDTKVQITKSLVVYSEQPPPAAIHKVIQN